MEEQLFKMEESAAFELGNSNCCLVPDIVRLGLRCLYQGRQEEQLLMVEPQAQDTALLLPFAGPPLALPNSRRAPAASSPLWSMPQSHPGHTDRPPLGMDKKSHQHIQRAPGTGSEIKLEG